MFQNDDSYSYSLVLQHCEAQPPGVWDAAMVEEVLEKIVEGQSIFDEEEDLEDQEFLWYPEGPSKEKRRSEDNASPSAPRRSDDMASPSEPRRSEDMASPSEPRRSEDMTSPSERRRSEDIASPSEPRLPEDMARYRQISSEQHQSEDIASPSE